MLASVVLRFSHEPLGDAELPPRARRIPLPAVGGERHPGTTSACAENTAIFWLGKPRHGNYLRVRGEYGIKCMRLRMVRELPPRARRILLVFVTVTFYRGTTSACAENTPATGGSCTQNWNYLRVRGEYIAPWRHRAMAVELPPRARRIHQPHAGEFDSLGTTSACAENTSSADRTLFHFRNYLRVRGEYNRQAKLHHPCRELPPRARRILLDDCADFYHRGTTSACAENTF